MFYALSWSVVALLLAAWSLALWALHALGTWALTQAGSLASREAGSPAPATLPAVPDWLAPWLPEGWAALLQGGLAALGPLVQQLLEAMPALAGGLTLAAWLVWGLGTFVLMILGAALHGLVALWRRERVTASPGQAQVLPAAP